MCRDHLSVPIVTACISTAPNCLTTTVVVLMMEQVVSGRVLSFFLSGVLGKTHRLQIGTTVSMFPQPSC